MEQDDDFVDLILKIVGAVFALFHAPILVFYFMYLTSDVDGNRFSSAYTAFAIPSALTLYSTTEFVCVKGSGDFMTIRLVHVPLTSEYLAFRQNDLEWTPILSSLQTRSFLKYTERNGIYNISTIDTNTSIYTLNANSGTIVGEMNSNECTNSGWILSSTF